MGAENSIQISETDFLRDFEEVRIEYNEEFGEIRILRNKSDPKRMVMIKEKWFNNAESYKKFQEESKKR